MVAEKTHQFMATQTNCAMQLLSLPHTVQRTHLPASVLFVVAYSGSTSSPQSPVPVTGVSEKRLLLPPTACKIISSPKKRSGKVSVVKDTSIPKKKRGRPRRDTSATVASSSVSPRPILPKVAAVVPVIALAGKRLLEVPHMATKKCSNSLPTINTDNPSTTLVSIPSDQSFSISSNISTSQKSSISLPHFKTTKHISASLKRFNPGERGFDCFSSPPPDIANDNLQEKGSMKPNISENGYEKITVTPSNSFGSATSYSSSENKSRNGLGVANLAMAQIKEDHLPQLEVCKIDSKRPRPVSTDSGKNQNLTEFAEGYQNNGFIKTECHKPLVIRSSSSFQPAHKVVSGETFSVIRISNSSQSHTSAISEMASLESFTNVSSIMGHCKSVSFPVKTKSLPVIHDHCNYYGHNILEGKDLLTSKPMVNTKPTICSFGIEHDEPLDASIVQCLNERLNSNSKHSALRCEADAERPTCGKALQQEIVNCSESNQFKVNRSEEPRDEHVSATDFKEAKKTFLCQVCGKLLNGRSNLKSHLLTHSSARPHVCHVCGKAFRRRHTFHIHTRTHTNENPYRCGRCPAAFKTRSNLVRHVVVHAARSRDYRCQECGKEFTSKLSLNSHRKVHASTGPCVCSQCGEAYVTMQSLRTHQLHHKYPDKQFKCKLCDKAYVFQSLLKRHMDGHNGVQKFHCHLCLATFAWKSSLAAHILTHYPKKYKCKLCSLSFNTEKRLTSHLKKHSEPNPHSCTLCLKKYPFRYLLVRHVKSAHGQKSFVTVKVMAVPRKVNMVRRISITASEASKGDNPRTALQELSSTASTSEFVAEQYLGNNDCSKSVTGSHKYAKQLPFSAVSQKFPSFKFRCVSAPRDHVPASVPRFTVSIGHKSECPVATQSNIVEQDTKNEPVICYTAQRTVGVAESATSSSPADVCNDSGSCEKQHSPSRSSSSYREPPSYYSASPFATEAFVKGSSDSPTFFRHSSAEKSKLQSEYESRSVTSCAHESYTPSYETFSSTTTFNDLLSPPGLGRYQKCGRPPHPNLLPASSDPYLQAASSAHSAYFPSPHYPGYDSPSSRHQSVCSSAHQASFNLPPHLLPNDGSSSPSPSQQSHGGLMYLATHSDYDLAGCLDDDALPDGGRS